MRRNPDLIVPIRDRRRGRRILTLRNLGIVVGAFVLVFAVVSISSEMRRPKQGEYGRLEARQVPQPVSATQPREIVVEAPVPDDTSADPMLVTSQARAQYLGVETPVQSAAVMASTPAPAVPAATTADDFQRPEPVLGNTSGKVTIVGDANGVALVTQTTGREQKLAGGYFRQQ
ncbi:MAG: hypothetical protein JOZ54_00530 [Acidobacteria bacterium]|nr:hypothetical protein [Acidobacteriota bacterium]